MFAKEFQLCLKYVVKHKFINLEIHLFATMGMMTVVT